MSWIGNTIYEWLEELCNDILSFLFNFINSLFIDGEALITKTAINSAAIIAGDIAVIIIAIVVLKNVFSIYILETDGDAEQDPLQQLVKATIAVALIQSSTYLFNWALNLANVFANELIKGTEVVLDTPDNFFAAFKTNVTGWTTVGMWTVILVIFIIGLVCLVIKAFIRGGELALMKILFPIFCCDLLTSSRERFNAFLTSFVVTTVGYAFQLLCFRLSMNEFVTISDSWMHIPIAYTWLFLAIKAPKWLEKYAYTSGLGGLARTGASSAGQVVMMSLARKAA